MTYAFDAEKVEWKDINGDLYLSWIIMETDVGLADEWKLEDLPAHFTITLLQVAVTGGQYNVNPELGLSPGWSTGSFDQVVVGLAGQAQTPHVRHQAPIKVTADGHQLIGRSKPSSAGVGEIKTRITLLEGHWQ